RPGPNSDNARALHSRRGVLAEIARDVRDRRSWLFLAAQFQTSSTEGQQLADELGSRPRVLTATGCVISEPKIAPSGFATFLFKLKSIELEGRKQSTHAICQVRWKGVPEFGDELKFFGTAEPMPPPRNPGEFD